MLRLGVELSFLWMPAAECSFPQVLLLCWGLCVCSSILVVALAAAPGLVRSPEGKGGQGRSCATMGCCRCQKGRKELGAVLGVAGKSVLCLSVKLINKSGFSSFLSDHKPSKYWTKIGFFDVCLHFLLKKLLQCYRNTFLTSKLNHFMQQDLCISHHSNLGEW